MRIETKQGKGNKIHISLDGEYRATVDQAFWYSCGYGDGDEIDEGELSSLLSVIAVRRAYNKALSLISIRDHGRRELLDKLKKDFDPDDAEAAVEKLEEIGYIDDKKFAENLADELMRRKKFAPKRIMQELQRRGIDRETAEEAVSGLDIDGERCIIELLETKFAHSLSDEKGIKRTFNTLLRMGYGVGEIKDAMRYAADEEQ
ncbi:MAG: recombination regulator RecX [Clostridiales bacterium]|nr:recombination regulator RecX [Clostridiales bacterium]